MIDDTDKEELTNIFCRRRVRLHHACQLKDFKSYITIRGVPSRDHLEKRKLAITLFDTDSNDKKSGVWDKVFFNFSDFGNFYHSNTRSIPNPYGPILLKLKPDGLKNVTDIAITLRSAGARDFDRKAEALTLKEVVGIFENPEEHTYPQSLKKTADLQKEFTTKKVKGSPEINLTTPFGFYSLDDVVSIFVDPIIVDGISLLEEVKKIVKQYDERLVDYVKGRSSKVSAKYKELVTAVDGGVDSLRNLADANSGFPLSRAWANDCLSLDLDYNFKRFTKYLIDGTLNELRPKQTVRTG